MTFTFDTGMLIALERRKARATQAFRAIVRRGLLPQCLMRRSELMLLHGTWDTKLDLPSRSAATVYAYAQAAPRPDRRG